MIRFEQSAPYDQEAARELAKTLKAPPLIAALLVQRGIGTSAQARAFFKSGETHDPFLLADMREAAKRVQAAIERRELVCVYGDYDVDGMCATALLMRYLGQLGADLTHYFPSRAAGYGVHRSAIDELHARGVRLLITVDCGISAIDEIAYARSLGMDTIVTDHHQCLESLPDGIVVNPKRVGSAYPFEQLCGTGVAAKLVQALGGEEALAPFWDIVAFATIADIVPLQGENRAFVMRGLARMRQGDASTGLQALMHVASVEEKTLNERQIGFALAPRLNAAGRMDSAEMGFELLMAEEEKQATRIAKKLDEANQERQRVESAIVDEACRMADECDLVHERALILSGEHWHSGVIGIVASRLVEKYAKPVVLLAREGDSFVGSCRSIRGVHIFEAVQHCADLLARYGGHEQAAGLTVTQENLDAFKRRFQQYLLERYAPDVFIPRMRYDLQASAGEMTLSLAKSLEKLAPFGIGNPMPVFRLSGVRITKPRTMGAQHTHLRGTLAGDGAEAPFVAFSVGQRIWEFDGDEPWDVLCSADVNVWNHTESLRLQLKSWRPSEGRDMRRVMKRRADLFVDGALYVSRADAADATPKAAGAVAAAPGNVMWADSADDMAAQVGEWLGQGVQGTLLIACTPECRLLDAAADADMHWGTLQRAHACAYHTLLLAPLGLSQDWGKFTRIAVLDSCLSAERRDALIASAGKRTLLLPREDGSAADFVRTLALTREEMAAYYRFMTAWCPQPKRFPSEEVFMHSAVEAMSAPLRPKARAALRVMLELSLLVLEARDGCVASMSAPGERRELTQSATFRRANEALEQYEALLGANEACAT